MRPRSPLVAVLAVLAALALVAPAAPARAQAPVRDKARAAYDRGLEAHKKGQFAVAAREFALADELQPSPVALRAAVDAAIAADDPALGMTLVARARRGGATPDLTASLDRARSSFARRTGRVVLVCNEGAPCEGTVDGTPVTAGSERYLLVGDHEAKLRAGGGEETRTIRIVAEDTLELRPSAALGHPVVAPPPVLPPSPPVPSPSPSLSAPLSSPPTIAPSGPRVEPEPSHKPLPPAVVLVGAGLTAIAGAFTIASAVDVQSKHDTFTEGRCDVAGSAACRTLADDGTSAEGRTNVLLVVTGGLALATTVVAITLVDFGGKKGTSPSATLSFGGAGLTGIRLGGAF